MQSCLTHRDCPGDLSRLSFSTNPRRRWGQSLLVEATYSLFDIANIMVTTCTAVKPSERVLIYSDTEENSSIQAALRDASERQGAASTCLTCSELEILEAASRIKDKFSGFDVIFAFCRGPFAYSFFSPHLRAGARAISISRLSLDSLLRIVPMDYELASLELQKLGKIFEGSGKLQISSMAGTSIQMKLANRSAILATGIAREPGELQFIPAGVLAVAPLETSCNGLAVIDGTILGVGRVSRPVHVLIEDGISRVIDSSTEAERLSLLLKSDKMGSVVGEFGMGTNSLAQLVGGPEDERFRGSVHLGFGENALFGGNIRSAVHVDATMLGTTLRLDDTVVVASGKVVL